MISFLLGTKVTKSGDLGIKLRNIIQNYVSSLHFSILGNSLMNPSDHTAQYMLHIHHPSNGYVWGILIVYCYALVSYGFLEHAL